MAILGYSTESIGQPGLLPRVISINTNDTIATVTTDGYLNKAVALGMTLSELDMALVTTKTTPSAVLTSPIFMTLSNTAGSWKLNLASDPGGVVLPTIAGRIAAYTNTLGTLSEDAATAVNAGNIQAGVSGTAGYLSSFPSAAAKGSLRLTAVANTGDTLVTLSNALHGQASVYSIPDSGAATANLILSKTTGVQHITVGSLQIDAGGLLAGLSTGGTAGSLTLYPATTTTGSLVLVPVSNVGNFAATLSNVTALGQATVYTLPDAANAIARVLVGATATPFTTAHILASSGTGGLVADSGIATSAVQLNTNIKAARTADIGGGGAGPFTITLAGVTTASIITASINTSSNTVSVAKVTAGTGNFAVLLDGDAGAVLTINYIAFIAAQ